MPQVQKTMSITIDDNVFEVAKMSEDVQQMVMYMDDWRQDEADLTAELLKTRAAIRDIQNSLLVTIRKEREDAIAKAEALGIMRTPEQPAEDQGE
jgi:hypothetical protein